MFSSIDNKRGIRTVQDVPNTCAIKKAFIDWLIERLELCLKKNNSVLANETLKQTNGTENGAPNTC